MKTIYLLIDFGNGGDVVAGFESLDALCIYFSEEYDVDLDDVIANPHKALLEFDLKYDDCRFYE